MEHLKFLANKLYNTHNKKLYIVWGFCREYFLWKNNIHGDIDIATDASVDEIESCLPCVWHVGKKYWTVIVKHNNSSYEVTSFRKDIGTINNRKPAQVAFTQSLKEDAQRRDFTCNSIYYDILEEKYIDPNNGKQDIQDKTLKFIGNIKERINEDALRILRYIRFLYKYNLINQNEDYDYFFSQNIHLLKNISIERIKQEFDKILCWPNNTKALEHLKKIGFIALFFPEIEKQSDTEWSKYHQEWNVWIHTKMTIDVLNKIIARNNFEQNKIHDLYRTMFLHDISKPETFSTDKNGNNHYYGHEALWADIFYSQISKTWKFSSQSRKKITWLIENHLRVFKYKEMKKRKIRLLMNHPFFEDLMLIWEADHMWRIPASYSVILDLHSAYEDFKSWKNQQTFYTGEDILRLYPDLTGAEIGKKLSHLNEQIFNK